VEYVWLESTRNQGYPWPETSLGLDPMYGPDGWCHECGIPLVPQRGPLILSRTARAKFEGAWIPYWQYNALCLDEHLAEIVTAQFDLTLTPIEWKGPGGSPAFQVLIPTTQDDWFDGAELSERAIARHGSAGQTCGKCGTWRWYGLYHSQLPPVRLAGHPGSDIFASPEWFGDGRNSFHEFLVSRRLAEVVTAATPRGFAIVEADIARNL
jgi:hypothetical protein